VGHQSLTRETKESDGKYWRLEGKEFPYKDENGGGNKRLVMYKGMTQ
jgi:hypothetical protein